jgi:hypothetical protein
VSGSTRMPGRVLFDTTIGVALFSGEKAVSQRFQQSDMFVPSTVLGELHYGARKSARTARDLARIDEFAASVQILDCDPETARAGIPISPFQGWGKNSRVFYTTPRPWTGRWPGSAIPPSIPSPEGAEQSFSNLMPPSAPERVAQTCFSGSAASPSGQFELAL